MFSFGKSASLRWRICARLSAERNGLADRDDMLVGDLRDGANILKVNMELFCKKGRFGTFEPLLIFEWWRMEARMAKGNWPHELALMQSATERRLFD